MNLCLSKLEVCKFAIIELYYKLKMNLHKAAIINLTLPAELNLKSISFLRFLLPFIKLAYIFMLLIVHVIKINFTENFHTKLQYVLKKYIKNKIIDKTLLLRLFMYNGFLKSRQRIYCRFYQ